MNALSVDATLSAPADQARADWPTTQRFSRRLGDAIRGADYAQAIEAPADPHADDAVISMLLIALLAVLAGLVIVLWAH